MPEEGNQDRKIIIPREGASKWELERQAERTRVGLDKPSTSLKTTEDKESKIEGGGKLFDGEPIKHWIKVQASLEGVDDVDLSQEQIELKDKATGHVNEFVSELGESNLKLIKEIDDEEDDDKKETKIKQLYASFATLAGVFTVDELLEGIPILVKQSRKVYGKFSDRGIEEEVFAGQAEPTHPERAEVKERKRKTSGPTFNELYKIVTDRDKPEDEREEAKTKIMGIYKEMEEKEIFDLDEERTYISGEVTNHRWDDVYSALKGHARSKEIEVRGSDGYDERYKNAAERALEIAALHVSVYGKELHSMREFKYDTDEPDEEGFSGWLHDKGGKPGQEVSQFEEQRWIVENASFVDLSGLPFEKIVGRKYYKEKELEKELGITSEDDPIVQELQNIHATQLKELETAQKTLGTVLAINKAINERIEGVSKGKQSDEKYIDAMGANLAPEVKKWLAHLDDAWYQMEQYYIKGVGAGLGDRELLESIDTSLKGMYQLQKAENIEALMVPTWDNLVERGVITQDDIEEIQQGVEDWAESEGGKTTEEKRAWVEDKKIDMTIEHIGIWFEDKLRLLETMTDTFEDRSEVSNPLLLATIRLEYGKTGKEQELGKKLRKKFEARRARQRMVRVWNLSLPEQIYGVSHMMSLENMQEMFADEEVTKEFQMYLKMGDDYKKAEDDGDKQLVGRKENEIVEYYEHGGRTTDGELLDKRIETLEAQESLNDNEQEKLETYKNQLWARKFAGGLYSITFEAARDNFQLNGTGDFFAKRVFNLAKFMENNSYAQSTRGIWRPDENDRSKDFDLGYRGILQEIASKIEYKDRGGKSSTVDEDGLNETQFVRYVCQGLGDERFWNMVSTGEGSVELSDGGRIRMQVDEDVGQRERIAHDAYAEKMYKYTLADEGRSALVGVGKFFYIKPKAEDFLALRKAFEYLSGKEKEKPAGLFGWRKIKGSDQQSKFQEVLDRTFDYTKTKEGRENLEEFGAFRYAEVRNWIVQALDKSMITRSQAKELVRQHKGILPDKTRFNLDMKLAAFRLGLHPTKKKDMGDLVLKLFQEI